jgi:hypothetical protein
MSHFDKFMKDIEQKQAREKKAMEIVNKDEENHLQRLRVQRYTERWQNSIRWTPRGKNDN